MIEVCTACVSRVHTKQLRAFSPGKCVMAQSFSQPPRIGMSRTKVGMCIIYTYLCIATTHLYTVVVRYKLTLHVYTLRKLYKFEAQNGEVYKRSQNMSKLSKPVSCCCTLCSNLIRYDRSRRIQTPQWKWFAILKCHPKE